MITKDKVLMCFNKDEQSDVVKVYEAMEISYTKDIPLFTKFFCTPNIWKYFAENFSSNIFCIDTSAGLEDGDRRIIAFNNIYNSPYPLKIIKILNNSKFCTLGHRDYLGAIMSLGITRDKLGDLRVNDNFAIVPVYEEIVDYIIDNLTMVRNSPVEIYILNEGDVPELAFKDLVITVASLRIDAIVSKLINISRNAAVDLINSNKILIDYSKIKDKSEDIQKGQRITITGVGKFIVDEIVGTTKSGRIRINIKKYI